MKLSRLGKVVSKFFKRFGFLTFVAQEGVEVILDFLDSALIKPVFQFRVDLPEVLGLWFDGLFYYINDRIEILLGMGVVDDPFGLRDLK